MSSERIMLTVLLLAVLIMTTSGCIYHEHEFNGTILDIDTKQPIEGAVVVVKYVKDFMGVGAGRIPFTINIQEALSDKDGKFHVPSYTTLLLPTTWKGLTQYLIYKPGYAYLESYPESVT